MTTFSTAAAPDHPRSLYINVVVRDHTAAVHRKVGQKIDQSALPPPLKALAHKTAPQIVTAGGLATSAGTAAQASSELSAKMPRQLACKGLQVQVHPVFQKGPYIVLQFSLERVHVAHLLLRKIETLSVEVTAPDDSEAEEVNDDNDAPSGSSLVADTTASFETQSLSEAWGEFVQAAHRASSSSSQTAWKVLALRVVLLLWAVFVALLGKRRQDYVEEVMLPRVLIRKMPDTMQTMIQDKMRNKHLVAEGTVLPESQQAAYFYQRIAQLADKSSPGGVPSAALSVTPPESEPAPKPSLPPRASRREARRRVVRSMAPPLRLSVYAPWSKRSPASDASVSGTSTSAVKATNAYDTLPARRVE